MKQILFAIIGILFQTFIFAQAPQIFNYQGVARDLSGLPLSNQTINLRTMILKSTTSGNIVYSETHFVTTNLHGLFNIEIGNGELEAGDFNQIEWSNDSYFLRIEIDPSGGINFDFLGTSQLLSVPYALHANTASNVDDADADPTNEIQTISVTNDTLHLSQSNSISVDEINYWKNIAQWEDELNYTLKTEWGQLSALIHPDAVSLDFDIFSDNMNISKIQDSGSGLNIFSPTGLTIWTQFNSSDNTYSQPLTIQGNGNVKINGHLDFSNIFGGGFIMRSNNGKCWQYEADNTGQLISTEITCPN